MLVVRELGKRPPPPIEARIAGVIFKGGVVGGSKGGSGGGVGCWVVAVVGKWKEEWK